MRAEFVMGRSYHPADRGPSPLRTCGYDGTRMSAPLLSVVLPIYNEALVLPADSSVEIAGRLSGNN